MSLADKLRSRLHDPWRIVLRRDPSEPARPRAASQARVRPAEPYPTEGIEHFPPELYVIALLKGNVLENPARLFALSASY